MFAPFSISTKHRIAFSWLASINRTIDTLFMFCCIGKLRRHMYCDRECFDGLVALYSSAASWRAAAFDGRGDTGVEGVFNASVSTVFSL
jgi:hypothetical protein